MTEEKESYQNMKIIKIRILHRVSTINTIQDKKTGYVIKFGDKKKLLKFMYFLEKNRFKINILGRNAKKNFDLKHNTNINLKKLTDIYLKT